MARASLSGVDQLRAKLQKRIRQAREGSGSVIVGYTAAYAVYVHENLTAYHPTGQAKFLEQPARELKNDGTFSGIIRDSVRRGATLIQALLLCGLRLQRESQLLVPVDTGNLKNSAFTRVEGSQNDEAALARVE